MSRGNRLCSCIQRNGPGFDSRHRHRKAKLHHPGGLSPLNIKWSDTKRKTLLPKIKSYSDFSNSKKLQAMPSVDKHKVMGNFNGDLCHHIYSCGCTLVSFKLRDSL